MADETSSNSNGGSGGSTTNLLANNGTNNSGTVLLVKLRFPPNYPVQSKTLPLDLSLTASAAVRQISTRLFKNFKISTSDVGLCVTVEPSSSSAQSPTLSRPSSVSWADFKKSTTFPFFQDDSPLENYKSIIASIEFLDFKEKAQLARLKILGDESATAIASAPGTSTGSGLGQGLLTTTNERPIKLRITFPPTYPVIAKTFLFSSDLTVEQTIAQIATQLNFSAATTVGIGLRLPQASLKTAPDALLAPLRASSSPHPVATGVCYPFLHPSNTLRSYEELLRQIETLEYAYIPRPEPGGGAGGQEQAGNLPAGSEEPMADKVLLPIMWKRPDKEGELFKVAKKNILNRATKRYVILQKDKLFYFKDKPDQQTERPLGAIFLTECTTISRTKSDEVKREHCLKIEENYSDEKIYYFAADSEMEIDMWLEALQKATTKKAMPLHVKHTAHINNRKSMDMTRLFSPGDPSQIFRDLVQLGKGGFSSVWSAIDGRTHQKVVIKLVKVTKITFKYILQEIMNHKNFQHPNIVQFIDSWYVPSTQQIWVVLELMGGGDLGRKVSPNHPMKESEISRILKEVLKALAYIHSLNKVHRDIKSDNILFSSDGTQVKLADFGFSTKLNGSTARVQSIVGTLHFMAPEILMSQNYGTSVDIWALGVLAIEMADGVPPNFMCRDITDTRNFIQKTGAPKLRDPRMWSPEFNSFISSCLRIEPTERPTADQLLTHPFITGANTTRRRPIPAAGSPVSSPVTPSVIAAQQEEQQESELY